MKSLGFEPLPAGADGSAHYFERSRRTYGGSARSYSEQVRSPEYLRAEKQRTAAILLLCVFLPPVGVICLWRGGFFSPILRAGATLVAACCMTLIFYLIIPEEKLPSYSPPVSMPSAVTEYSPSSAAAVYGAGEAGTE